MVEYCRKIEDKVKAMQSEIKENIRRTNSEGKETETQINNLGQKEEINIQSEENEKTIIQKKIIIRTCLGNSGTTLNVPISKSKGCQKEEKEQGIENLF